MKMIYYASEMRRKQIVNLSEAGVRNSEIARLVGVSRQRVHQILNGSKDWARQKVSRAIRDGWMQRGVACASCGSSNSVTHGHHPDYSKWDEVEWLCAPCHKQRHSSLSS
ncbi:hypothetical protein LCGC14_0587900 [marine sediment metagenome]|uniref:Uncharacterized protein n=1 Tax=marine sediment metagenome TaxID=412755 RepID=A0A0F9RYA4_9ZZZZ